MGLLPARGPLGRLRDAALKAVMRRVFDRALAVLNQVRRDHGLSPLPSFFAQLSQADHVLVLTSAAFDFCSSSRPPKVSWVGPELDDPSWASAWQSPFSREDARPLVLVGLGSTFQNQIDVLRKIVAAFDGLEARGLVTLGPAIRTDEVTSSANAVVVQSAPHSVVLREASVFVTHAGHGAAIKGAAAGVPMLCIPLGRDQADNAVRVAHHGAGITLKPTASVEQIRATLRRLLTEPTYRDNARALAEAIRRREGDADAVSILESLTHRAVKTGRASQHDRVALAERSVDPT
jgi:MGT family glycosyltransferase